MGGGKGLLVDANGLDAEKEGETLLEKKDQRKKKEQTHDSSYVGS